MEKAGGGQGGRDEQMQTGGTGHTHSAAPRCCPEDSIHDPGISRDGKEHEKECTYPRH